MWDIAPTVSLHCFLFQVQWLEWTSLRLPWLEKVLELERRLWSQPTHSRTVTRLTWWRPKWRRCHSPTPMGRPLGWRTWANPSPFGLMVSWFRSTWLMMSSTPYTSKRKKRTQGQHKQTRFGLMVRFLSAIFLRDLLFSHRKLLRICNKKPSLNGVSFQAAFANPLRKVSWIHNSKCGQNRWSWFLCFCLVSVTY